MAYTQHKKLLINSSDAVQKNATVLRQAQHEREILTASEASSVRPELVERWTEGFSTASKRVASPFPFESKQEVP
jgi:hypothetical protein